LWRIQIERCALYFHVSETIMSGQTPMPIEPVVAVATLLALGVGLGIPTNIARADDCLAAPNTPAPEGSHWYYQTDRATQTKCWFLRAKGESPQRATQAQSQTAPAMDSARKKPATASVGAPMSISPADSAPLVPAVKRQPRKTSATPEELTEESSPKVGSQSSVPAPGMAEPTNMAGEDSCMTAPNSPAPQGKHWFYRTDRATQRKCWYLRAKHQPTQHTDAQAPSAAAPATHASTFESATASADASISKSPTNSARPSAKPQPAFMRGANPEGVEQSAPKESAQPSSPAEHAPHQLAASVPAAAGMSPYAITAATAGARELNEVSSVARSHSARPPGPALNNAEGTTRGGASSTNAAGITTSVTWTLVSMLLIVALGLGVAGFLHRVVTAIARRRQIIREHPESTWIGSENPHHWHDNQERHRSADERGQVIGDSPRSPLSNANDSNDQQQQKLVDECNQFIGDLRRSSAADANDCIARPLHAANDESSDNARRTGGASQITDEVRKREERLAQLKRDLDCLLQLPKRA